MACCNAILDLGKIGNCSGKFNLIDIHSLEGGIYTLEANYLGSYYHIKAQIEPLALIEFPVNELNENHVFVARIYDPQGNPVKKMWGGVEYECFSFETVFIHTITVNE